MLKWWKMVCGAALLAVSLASALPAGQAYAAAPLWDDDFNGGAAGAAPSGYTLSEAGGTVRVVNVPSASNKSVYLNDTSTTGLVNLKKTFASQTGTTELELKFMQPAMVNNTKIIRLLSGNTPAVSIETISGGIAYRNADNTYTTLISGYQPNIWYSIRIVANAATDKADVYLNGVKKVSQASFYSAVSVIDGLESYTPNSSAGSHYLDDIVVKPAASGVPSGALIVDAAGGSGVYTTVQAAIDAIPVNNTTPRTIYVKNGTYNQKLTFPANKPYITLLGESAAGTILTYNDSASSAGGTTNSSSVFVYGNDFTAENITFQNTAGPAAGQAVALYVGGDRASFRNVRILGNQDTLYANGSGRQYYRDSYIEGTVDFVFGSATAVFENCELKSKNGGYVTAASTDQSKAYGYVFITSSLTTGGAGNDTVALGRPWRPYSSVTYLYTWMDTHIKPAGWDDWGNAANQSTARYKEFGSTGPGADAASRVSWAGQLTSSQAGAMSAQSVLAGSDGWDPTY
ncbi:pectinesterase family protein [Paenibacillus sp. OAS669]|uniref:pectinesterase family protein n=1 Tax=Paenibacillus sp. OAS669 TaxID=2663821 RepID=UPI001A0E6652|nr:pectinesterase family protein [Paenibacillus sp. OAS669]MBE1441463.1 pectin methylesterase-like acyl-CoA thioesterase [Paenibacillus sp. OAS669]